jgi:hypothetical protein
MRQLEINGKKACITSKHDMIPGENTLNLKQEIFLWFYWPISKAGMSQKLLPRWDISFKIKERIGKWSYRIEKRGRLFSVYVQRLTKYRPMQGL